MLFKDGLWCKRMKSPFFVMDGKEFCDHERALAQLLKAEVLFCNNRLFDPDTWNKPSGKLEGPTVLLFVNANDVFAWASADAENLTLEEIGPLWKAWKQDKKWGVIKWLCAKRHLRPQRCIVDEMRQGGVWDSDLESLPAPFPS